MKHYLLITAMALASITPAAKTLRLGENPSPLMKNTIVVPQTPKFDISISPDSTSATFTVTIPTVDVDHDNNLFPSTYWWTVDEFFPSSVAGEASLPQRSLIFQLPGNADNITLTENFAHWQTIDGYTPTPARPPLRQEPGVAYTLENVPPISQYASADAPVASISSVTRQRNSKIAYIHLQPFRQTDATGTVAVCHEFSYTLTFDKSETRNKPQRSIANYPFLPTDSFKIVDPRPGHDTPGQPAEVTDITNSLKHLRPSNYLIITTPSNYHAIKQYSEWKKMLGHKVQIVATENWSRQLIKSTIASCYQNDTALHYVLFAGSINDIPAALDDLSDTKYAHGPNYTDFPYAVLDSEYNGTNCDRSVYTGRLLVDSPQQMPVILNKLRNIYKLGANNPSFHKRAAHIAYFDITDDCLAPDTETNTFMVGTSEKIYERVTNQGKNISRLYYKHRHAIPTFMRDIREGVKPLPDFLTYPQYAWDADSTDVIRAFNSGMHYIYTNAHGSISSWAEPGPNWDKPVFASRQMHFLNNADKLPYVFSISCYTGNFNEKNGMAKTLLNSKNGACGVIASTSYMWCSQTPYFAMGIFNTIWADKRDDNTNPNTTINLDPIRFAFDNCYKEYVDEEWYTMGNIMDLGMRYQYLTSLKNPTNSIPKDLKETTHIYGDPGIFFNTDTPTDIENVHFRFKNESKHVLGNQSEIVPTISISLDSHAIIGIYNETTNEVARYYNSWVIHPVSPTDKFHVVITQHNKLPLEFHVENGIISASGPYVGDANKIPELRLKSVRQTSANAIEATYDFDEYNSAEYSGTIMIKDMNNNILAQQGVSEQNGTVTLSSSQITNGIYVVVIQSPTHAASYQKILIK